MTSRERVVRALTHRSVDRVPRQLWRLPGVAMFQREAMNQLIADYPPDIIGPGVGYRAGKRCQGTPNVVGKSTDAWGCVWEVKEDGVVGEIKHALFENEWEDLDE